MPMPDKPGDVVKDQLHVGEVADLIVVFSSIFSDIWSSYLILVSFSGMCHDALFPLPSLFVSGDVGLVGHHRLAVVAAPYVVEEKVVEGSIEFWSTY